MAIELYSFQRIRINLLNLTIQHLIKYYNKKLYLLLELTCGYFNDLINYILYKIKQEQYLLDRKFKFIKTHTFTF
jgi:hypothetical protein